MQKRLFIVHGWDGNPTEGWFPWLTRELEGRGFAVYAPALPEAKKPLKEKWVPALAAAIGTPDKETYLIGHSMGCQTIVRYLESLPHEAKIGGAVFVAGFLRRLTEIEDTATAKAVVANWLEAPIDLRKAALHLPKSVAIFSDNDPYVPLDNADDFRDKLSSEIVIEKNMGHFTGGDDGILELPVVLESLLKVVQI